MSTHLSIRGALFFTVLAWVLPAVAFCSAPPDRTAVPSSQDDLTMGAWLTGPAWLAVADLPHAVRASSVKDDNGRELALAGRLELKKDYILEVEFRGMQDGLIRFRKPEPSMARLSAPIYLGKPQALAAVPAADLQGKRALVTIWQDEPRMAVESDQSIVCAPIDCRNIDGAVELRFPEEIKVHAQRPIGMKPIMTKSFDLLDRWVSGGEELRIRVPIADIDKGASQLAVGFWTDNPGSQMEDEAYRAIITGIEPERTGEGIYSVKARVPYLQEIDHVLPGWLSPVPPLVKMTVTVNPGNGSIVSETFDLRIARRGWGIAAGLLFVFVTLLLIMNVTHNFNPFQAGSNRFEEWKKTYKSGKLIRFFFSPLDLAVTPFGTYSISVTQAIFWTFIVTFSCVYVYMLKAAFIVIPDQILLLLGIAGGTALASRVNSMSKDLVPKELTIDTQRSDIPRLRDLISIAGKLNIYKFQMVVFTVITGIIVVVELIKASNFPEIPNTLVTLMGLSNTLYLGNEVTVEPVQGLREKVKAYKDEANQVQKAKLGEEIKMMLSQY